MMIGYWLFVKATGRAYCFVWEYERAKEIAARSKEPLEIEEAWVED